MKYIYLLIINMAVSLNLSSQDIDGSWFFESGQQVFFSEASNATSLDVPESGLNMTWDFTSAIVGNQDTLFYVEPAGFQNADKFPEATVAELNSGSNQVVYIDSKTDSFNLIGFNIEENLYLTFDPPFLIAAAPLSYGDTLHHQASQILVSDGVEQPPREIDLEIIFSGIGTVQTPNGDFDNCILLERWSTDVESQLVTYAATFFKDNLVNRIATYSVTPDPISEEIITRFDWTIGFLLSDVDDTPFDLGLTIQNDLLGNVSLNTDQNMQVSINVMNASGQLIFKNQAQLHAGRNEINLMDLPKGQYYMNVIDQSTGNFKTVPFSQF